MEKVVRPSRQLGNLTVVESLAKPRKRARRQSHYIGRTIIGSEVFAEAAANADDALKIRQAHGRLVLPLMYRYALWKADNSEDIATKIWQATQQSHPELTAKRSLLKSRLIFLEGSNRAHGNMTTIALHMSHDNRHKAAKEIAAISANLPAEPTCANRETTSQRIVIASFDDTGRGRDFYESLISVPLPLMAADAAQVLEA